jgi:hypothetical protein
MATNNEPEPEDVASPAMGAAGTRYVVFDPETGRIVGTYGVLDAETGEYREQSEADVRAMFEGTKQVRGAGTPLGVLPLDVEQVPVGPRPSRLRVDPAERTLVRRPQLRLTTDRPAITGDGADSVEITVIVVNPDGGTDESFAAEVRVSTTHGRLSVPGGRVAVRGGTAAVTLTSTPETIERVSLTARDPRGVAETAWLDLEFR